MSIYIYIYILCEYNIYLKKLFCPPVYLYDTVFGIVMTHFIAMHRKQAISGSLFCYDLISNYIAHLKSNCLRLTFILISF